MEVPQYMLIHKNAVVPNLSRIKELAIETKSSLFSLIKSIPKK